MSAPTEQSPYRLLVEGSDDLWTVVNVMKRHGYNWDDPSILRPYIHDAGGIDQVLEEKFLRSSLKTHQKLGVIIDVDFPPQDRYAQAKRVFTRLGIALPENPGVGGL